MALILRLVFFTTAVLCVIFAGCSSSETTQKEPTAGVNGAVTDTSVLQPEQGASEKRPRNQRLSSSGKQQGFVTQEDTIEAQVLTRSQEASHSKAPPQRATKKKYYSVQIGAFRILSNADRAQKLAKQRYKKPVYHFYDKAIKMYRVTVGNFSKIKDAFAFLKAVQHQHPKEYKDAWVAEMRR
jgi:cell division septation protein DedD